MISTLKQEEVNYYLVTICAVWLIHEGKFQSPLSTHLFVESFLRDIEAAREKLKGGRLWPAMLPYSGH